MVVSGSESSAGSGTCRPRSGPPLTGRCTRPAANATRQQDGFALYTVGVMTVILHTHAGAPALAGDMLISKKGPGPTSLKLPSQPNGIVIPTGKLPEYVPVRMRRKVFIINDHVSVGAAGSVSHIAAFLPLLRDAFGAQRAVTFAEVSAFLEDFASSETTAAPGFTSARVPLPPYTAPVSAVRSPSAPAQVPSSTRSASSTNTATTWPSRRRTATVFPSSLR